MKKIKPILVIVEHFALFGLIVAGIAFYLGVQYGQAHSTQKAATTAPVASQSK